MPSSGLPPFSSIPFLPLLTDLPSSDLLTSLSLIVPLLIPLSLLASILPEIPSNADYWVIDLEGQGGLEEVAKILDGGAGKVITGNKELVDSAILDKERLVVFDESVSGELENKASGILKKIDSLEEFSKLQGTSKTIKTYILASSSFPTASIPSLIKPKSFTSVPIIPISQLSISPTSEKISIVDLFISTLTFTSSDGSLPDLIPTVPVSLCSTPLGLVYSSKESISKSLLSPPLATYFSRSRNSLWTKGLTSQATQDLYRIRLDCDGDALEFLVKESGERGDEDGFCHVEGQKGCFGIGTGGLESLQEVLISRLKDTEVKGSYTQKLFSSSQLLKAKILEEATEFTEATTSKDIVAEFADLIYFGMVRLVKEGVKFDEVLRELERRKSKVIRRKGDAKKEWVDKLGMKEEEGKGVKGGISGSVTTAPPPPPPLRDDPNTPIQPKCYKLSTLSPTENASLLKRPSASFGEMIAKVTPIIHKVKSEGDKGLREFVSTFDRCPSASNPEFSLVINAPFPAELMKIPEETKQAIDTAYSTIKKFHSAQIDPLPLKVETFPGVVCTRFPRAIESVGLYVPGGSAILPSTALMLAIPASVAGCSFISLATPPKPDGSISPEIVYIASLCGVDQIVKAGGAQAIGAMAWGTESVRKVDKVFGPGNQWVTAAKAQVGGDSEALVSIDMPAGPSEVLVIADSTSVPSFVASDLLSQAEHGPDSQVVLLAISLSPEHLSEILKEVDAQARALPRVEIVEKCIKNNSHVIEVESLEEALDWSNKYAPEHLIIHVEEGRLDEALQGVRNAGSVFLGKWSPESCGDYASGTNHTLPTLGYAKQYSGVSTSSFLKHITSQKLTEAGLKGIGPTVERLAEVEELMAHRNAVTVRLKKLKEMERA